MEDGELAYEWLGDVIGGICSASTAWRSCLIPYACTLRGTLIILTCYIELSKSPPCLMEDNTDILCSAVASIYVRSHHYILASTGLKMPTMNACYRL